MLGILNILNAVSTNSIYNWVYKLSFQQTDTISVVNYSFNVGSLKACHKITESYIHGSNFSEECRNVLNQDSNICLTAAYVIYYGDYLSGQANTGFYSQIPFSQLMGTGFKGSVLNDGNLPQHNVRFTVDITNSAGDSVYNGYKDTAFLPVNSTVSLDIDSPLFFAPSPGFYTAHFIASQDETDQSPSDNTLPDVSFCLSENEIFARDVNYCSPTSPELYEGGDDGDVMGVQYHIQNAVSVKSISVFIDILSDTGTIIKGQLYVKNGTTWNIQIEADDHIITPADLGTWIELPLIAYTPGDEFLAAHNDYAAGVMFYYGTQHLFIGADDQGSHMYNVESFLRLGSEYYWIHELPMVRLNLEGAILPPVFCSVPDTIAMASPCSYEYTACVTDANGYTCSFEITEGPWWMVFNDNGDNTFTIYGIPPVSSLNTSELIVISANNGYAINTQYYLLDIVQCATINHVNNPSAKIFPIPANDVITILNTHNADIYIYNIAGRLIFSEKDACAFTTVDMSGNESGTYFVKFIYENNVVLQKISLIR